MKLEKKYKKLLILLQKLEPVEFIGLMRLFDIPLVSKGAPRQFSELLSDFTEKWLTLSFRQRRNLETFLKQVGSQKDN